MYDPTLQAASAMMNLRKCNSCERAVSDWRGYKIPGCGKRPNTCNWLYKPRQDIVLAVAEGAFK